MVNKHPVMWTKDSAYNTQGVLQEGGPENFSSIIHFHVLMSQETLPI